MGAAFAGFTVYRTVWYSHAASKHELWRLLGYAVAGGLVAIGMLYLSIWIGGLIDRRIARAREQKDPSTTARWSQAFLRGLFDWPAVGEGFVTKTPTGHFALAPGHGLALGLASSSVMLYVGIGFLTRNIDRSSLSSALAYALLLQLLLTWLLGFLIFLFDRGRIPLVVILGAWVLVVNLFLHHFWSTDHIYRTVKAEQEPVLPAVATLLPPDRPSIVVAASGGGIQAAAWTARY